MASEVVIDSKGMRAFDWGSEVTCTKLDGTVTIKPATYWNTPTTHKPDKGDKKK